MNIIKTPIENLLVLEPKVFEDERGYFFESFNKKKFEDIGIKESFVQDNQSLSNKNVLRGLHFQAPPFAQGKLVRVITGSVLDIAVDIRKESATYGKYFSVILSEQNKKMFWIPPGFAHGFLTLEDQTIFSYKCSGDYNPSSEGSLLWNDPQLNIEWNIDEPIVSAKDQEAQAFTSFKSPF
ncbi:MAG: dTDP-4-dehydrorhamnose 3,5-epimerase [Flavobacteriales bacterium]|jgi:dTDP-4-dehydrorhamnose 3,5-epimerase